MDQFVSTLQHQKSDNNYDLVYLIKKDNTDKFKYDKSKGKY